MYKMICSLTSPYARKLRVAAIELGLDKSIKIESATVGIGKFNNEYSQRINPLRKYPVLVLENGDVLLDSFVISEFLDNLAGGGRLIPATGPARWRVLTAHSIAQGMLDALFLYRMENVTRPESLRWQLFLDDQWERVDQTLKWFEARAAHFTEPLNIGHIALGCTLAYLDLRFTDYEWRTHFPQIAEFFAEISVRPAMITTAPPQS